MIITKDMQDFLFLLDTEEIKCIKMVKGVKGIRLVGVKNINDVVGFI